MTNRFLLLPFALFLVILPFPGTVAARLLLLVAFSLSLWLFWLHREDVPPVPGKGVIVLWAATCLASLAYAIDPGYSLREVKNEVGYTMMAFFAFFVVAGNPSDTRRILLSLVAGLAIIGGWGLLAWLQDGLHWNEAAGHGGSGVFATYLVTVAPALAYLCAVEHSPRVRLLLYATLPLLLVLAFATGQRVVWLALAAQGAVIWWALARRAKIARAKSVAIVLAIVATALAGLLISHEWRAGPEGGALWQDQRLRFWPVIVATIKDNPLTGAGMGRRALAKAHPEKIPEEAPLLWHAHNVFLNYGLSLGVPGILVLALLFGWWIRYFASAMRGEHPRALAGAAGLPIVIGVLLRNQFNDFFVRDMSLMFRALTGLFARLAVPTASAPYAVRR